MLLRPLLTAPDVMYYGVKQFGNSDFVNNMSSNIAQIFSDNNYSNIRERYYQWMEVSTVLHTNGVFDPKMQQKMRNLAFDAFKDYEAFIGGFTFMDESFLSMYVEDLFVLLQILVNSLTEIGLPPERRYGFLNGEVDDGGIKSDPLF